MEMDVGEAFVFLASAVHAGGANTTEHGRTVHGFFYCRSYMRPEVSRFVFVNLGLDAARDFREFFPLVHCRLVDWKPLTDWLIGKPTSLVDQGGGPAVVCCCPETGWLPDRPPFPWILQ